MSPMPLSCPFCGSPKLPPMMGCRYRCGTIRARQSPECLRIATPRLRRSEAITILTSALAHWQGRAVRAEALVEKRSRQLRDYFDMLNGKAAVEI